MGWVCLAVFGTLWNTLPHSAFLWLLAGGIVYTAGGVIYALKLPIFNARHKYFGSHEIFHLLTRMSILHTRAVSPLYSPDFVPLKRSPTFRTNQAHTSSLLSQPALSISDTELTKGVHTQTSLQNTNNMTGQTSVFSLKPTCVYVCR